MTEPKKQENVFLNLALNLIIPSVIMTKFSDEESLGQVYGLIVALAFPIIYGSYDLITSKKFNFFSLLGLVSVLLTGSIGLFGLNRNWMIIKETAIPLLMGIAVLYSQRTQTPLVRSFLNQVMDLTLVKTAFQEKGKGEEFEKTLNRSSYLLGSTFFVSALLNYILADYILVGQPGTVEFNQSLGKMTALSFPVITVPMVIMVGIILTLFFKNITKTTELNIENIFRK